MTMLYKLDVCTLNDFLAVTAPTEKSSKTFIDVLMKQAILNEMSEGR